MRFKFYALQIVLLCIIIFIFQLIIPGFTDFFVLDENAFTQIWRFVTSIFLHGSFGHLLYNMFALALFGSLLEKFVGRKKFLLIFLITGILANAVSINFYDSSLGASGAIYGVFGVLMIIRPKIIVWAAGFPMPMLIAGFVWAAGDLVGIFAPSNVGHIAHLSGMLFGLIFGAVLRPGYGEKESRDNKVILDEDYMRKWEDYYLRD